MRQDVGWRGRARSRSLTGSQSAAPSRLVLGGLLGRRLARGRLLGRRPSSPGPSSPWPCLLGRRLLGRRRGLLGRLLGRCLAAAFLAAAFLRRRPPSWPALRAFLAAPAFLRRRTSHRRGSSPARRLASAVCGQGQLGDTAGRVEPGQHEGAHLPLLQHLARLGRRRRAHRRQRDVAVQAPPPGIGTSTIAPCDVNDTTSPSTVLPTV